MAINNKAQATIVFIMVAIIVFIMSIQFIPVLTYQNNATTTALNCTGDMTTNTQVTCSLIDMSLFYFISICIATGLALLSGKRTILDILGTIMVFIIVVLLITPLKTFITLARGATYLNCGNAGISVAAKMTCIFVDMWLFYFVVVALAGGITWFIATRVMPQEGQQ